MSDATVLAFGTEAEEKAYWLGRADAKREAVAPALTVGLLAALLCSTHHLVPTGGHELTSDAVDREHGPQARAILAALRDEP